MNELNEVKLRQANRVRWCDRLSAVTTLEKRGGSKKVIGRIITGTHM